MWFQMLFSCNFSEIDIRNGNHKLPSSLLFSEVEWYEIFVLNNFVINFIKTLCLNHSIKYTIQ